MDAIIYKFTIIAKYKFKDSRPFYIGQHWEYKSIEHFLSNKKYNYHGSGMIWNDFILKIKKDYPVCWRRFIKREILFCSKNITQIDLDILEADFIEKEKSHYSFNIGGCNVAWGGNGSRMDESTKKKLSELNLGKIISAETRQRMSISRRGIKLSEETKIKISLSKIGDKNPMKIEEIRNKVSEKRKGLISWNKGKNLSFEHKRKLSESNIGRIPYNKGNKMSENQKAKLRTSLKGRKLSEKHRENIRKYNIENPPMKGKHHSEETKLKISNHFIGVSPGNKGKVCINNGNKNKYININDELPDGWGYGKFKTKKTL